MERVDIYVVVARTPPHGHTSEHACIVRTSDRPRTPVQACKSSDPCCSVPYIWLSMYTYGAAACVSVTEKKTAVRAAFRASIGSLLHCVIFYTRIVPSIQAIEQGARSIFLNYSPLSNCSFISSPRLISMYVLPPSHFTRRFGEGRGAVKMLLTRTVAVFRFIVEYLNLDNLMQC
jgi:hypothetical protein